jgi:hypothetical protein
MEYDEQGMVLFCKSKIFIFILHIQKTSKLIAPSYFYDLTVLIFVVYQRMFNGGRVSHWMCINFSRSVQDSAARNFCHELAVMCQVSGMVCPCNKL